MLYRIFCNDRSLGMYSRLTEVSAENEQEAVQKIQSNFSNVKLKAIKWPPNAEDQKWLDRYVGHIL